MSSAATASPSPTLVQTPRRRAKSQKKRTATSVSDLILRAASAPTERGDVSLAALKRALKDAGYDVVKNRARILTAIRRLVANKSLLQTKGAGASGSFKVNKKPPAPRKKRVKKKTRAKQVRRVRVKKAAAGATPAAKRSPQKRKAKSPKTAKRPAAAKKPSKAKGLRKVKRKVVKSMRTRSADKK